MFPVFSNGGEENPPEWLKEYERVEFREWGVVVYVLRPNCKVQVPQSVVNRDARKAGVFRWIANQIAASFVQGLITLIMQ